MALVPASVRATTLSRALSAYQKMVLPYVQPSFKEKLTDRHCIVVHCDEKASDQEAHLYSSIHHQPIFLATGRASAPLLFFAWDASDSRMYFFGWRHIDAASLSLYRTLAVSRYDLHHEFVKCGVFIPAAVEPAPSPSRSADEKKRAAPAAKRARLDAPAGKASSMNTRVFTPAKTCPSQKLFTMYRVYRDTERDDDIIRERGADKIIERRLRMYRLVTADDAEQREMVRSDPALVRLFGLMTEDDVCEDEIGFRMVHRSVVTNDEFFEEHRVLSFSLQAAWRTLEMKLINARLKVFSDDVLHHHARARWGDTSVSPLTTNELLTEIAKQLMLVPRLNAKQRMQLAKSAMDWASSKENIAHYCNATVKKGGALFFSIEGVEDRYTRFFFSRFPALAVESSNWTIEQRNAIVSQCGSKVYGDRRLMEGLLAAVMMHDVLMVRADGCDCVDIRERKYEFHPKLEDIPATNAKGGVATKSERLRELRKRRKCTTCEDLVQESWFGKKKCMELSRFTVRTLVHWIYTNDQALAKRYLRHSFHWSDHVRLLGLPRHYGYPTEAFIPPCILALRQKADREELSEREVLTLRAFDAAFLPDPILVERMGTKKRHIKALKPLREHMRKSLFGRPRLDTRDLEVAQWSCSCLHAHDQCPMASTDEGYDLHYRKRCRAEMKQRARRHIRVELDTSDDDRSKTERVPKNVPHSVGVVASGRSKWEIAARIEQPSDFSLSLLALRWQVDSRDRSGGSAGLEHGEPEQDSDGEMPQ
jgi:hypothetical protein